VALDMLRRRLVALSAGAISCWVLACSGNPLPGNMLGTYQVVAQSQTNSCGLAAPDPWDFDAQLSEQGTTLYWSWMDGSPPLSAAMSTSSQGTLLANEQLNVDGTADGGLGPCTMARADTLQIDLGSGSPPSAFSGTIEYVFSVAPGWDCADQLASAGGQYAALPCTITYTMSATRQ
jgi:hypothetical protein